jgi:hypothetical protein
MWWRVTGLALIMCGSSPNEIGSVAWKEHPTLRTLMKMVTSDRYKFPTVDCDESARDEMKTTEQAMRDEVSRETNKVLKDKTGADFLLSSYLGVENHRTTFPPQKIEEKEERNHQYRGVIWWIQGFKKTEGET